MNRALIKKIWLWLTTSLTTGVRDSSKSPPNPQIPFVLMPLDPRLLLSAGLLMATADSPPPDFDNQYEVVCEASMLDDINDGHLDVLAPESNYIAQTTEADLRGGGIFNWA